MSRPGDTAYHTFQVLDATGAGVTGLTLANFTKWAQTRPYVGGSWATWTDASALVEIGSGWYALAFTLPAAGWWRYRLTPNTASYVAYPDAWEDETELQDLDSVYANVVKTVATLTTTAQLGNTVPIELVANRYRQVDISITDSAGNAYNVQSNFPDASLRMSVRSADQTTTKWDAGPTATPTGFTLTSVGSVLTFIIPEGATFFSALGAGATSLGLFYEITGDLGGDTTKTMPIIRSSALTLSRREVGT